MIILILELSDINRVGYKNCIVQNEDMVMEAHKQPNDRRFLLRIRPLHNIPPKQDKTNA